MGRASVSRLREPGFESCAAVFKPWASFFTLHCSSSLSCINEYLAIDSGGYVYEQPLHINCSIWLALSQRSWDGVWLNKAVREVKCIEQSWGLDTALYKNLSLPFFSFDWHNYCERCCVHRRVMCDVSLVSLYDVCRLLQGGCAGCVGAVHKCNDPQRAGVTRHRHTTPPTNRGIVLATASLTTSQAGHLHDHHMNPNPATLHSVRCLSLCRQLHESRWLQWGHSPAVVSRHPASFLCVGFNGFFLYLV